MSTSRALRRAVATGATVALASLGLVALVAVAPARADEVYPLPATGTITVHGHGFGHGHGMSQYGARGAAIGGHSAGYIMQFYYPNTSLVTLPSPITLRVWLPGAGNNTCVQAAAGLMATDIGYLPTSGVTRFRIVPSGSGTAVQQGNTNSCTAGTWTTVKDNLPAQADFASTQGYVRSYRSDGTSTSYRGWVGAVRSGTGEITVNRVDLDQYTMGVAPREMPASWEPAAVQAQAIAARSYAEYEREHAGSRAYDICDSDQCQVYGGMTHYDSAGTVLWSDDPAAITGDSMQVVQYQGATAFTQFSASDGGWTVDGGQPYLIAKADPWDNAGTGDPYLNWTETVAVTDIASYYGLSRVSDVGITARDGNGDWGGRVLSGYVDGVDAHGAAQHITDTGFGLQNALGLPQNWFTLAASAAGPPTNVTAVGGDGVATVSWSPPTTPGDSPITGYTVTVGSRVATVSATTGSVWFAGLINGVTLSASVHAMTGSVAGASTSVPVTPLAAPGRVTAVTPTRLFDTGTAPVDPAHPYSYAFTGPGYVSPNGMTGVQFALTITGASASGVLHVETAGAPTVNTAAIAYRQGRTVTVMVSVPTAPSGVVLFEPSAGSVRILADQMAWSGPHGDGVASVTPNRVSYLRNVPIGDGVAVAVRGSPGVPADADAVILSVSGGPLTGSGYLTFWADGTPRPGVSQVTVAPDGSGASTVVVPVGTDGSIRMASNTSSIGAMVTVVGYLAPYGPGRGSWETYQSIGMADGGAGVGSAVAVGPGGTTVTVLGRPQVPALGVPAAMLEVTVYLAGSAGGLYAWAAGTPRPIAYSATFPQGSPSTTTLFVPVGANGAITLATSGPSAIVSVDSVGWITLS